MASPPTALDSFLKCARGDNYWRPAVQLGDDIWTYGDLDRISTGIALDLEKSFPKPSPTTVSVVTCISTNHPFVIALSLAAWKAGAVFAPLDPSVPRNVLQAMLANMKPSVIYDAAGVIDGQHSPEGAVIIHAPFDTMDTLAATYTATLKVEHPAILRTDMALYIHTSSATGPHNIKCVPITHEQLGWYCADLVAASVRHIPDGDYQYMRVLGISPFAHVMAHIGDLAWTYETSGCYIFPNLAGAQDMAGAALEALLSSNIDVLLSIPFLAGRIKEAYLATTDSARLVKMDAALRRLKIWATAGSQADKSFHEWAASLKLALFDSLGMTEIGFLFYGPVDLNSGPGYKSDHVACTHAEIRLVDEHGEPSNDSGELIITGKFIRNYLNRTDSAFKVLEDGRTEFHTGDLYSRTHDGRIIWEGRRDDFIQLTSGEKLDPRPMERALQLLPFVANAVLVGDKFLSGPSEHICALVELREDASILSKNDLQLLVATVGRENLLVTPSLRVPWSRIILLPRGIVLPLNRKMAPFRKLLQELHGETIAEALRRESSADEIRNSILGRSFGSATEIQEIILEIISNALGLEHKVLLESLELQFAELGLTSILATAIASNLNKRFALSLPPNICHVRVHSRALVEHVLELLYVRPQVKPTSASQRHATPARDVEDDDIAIVGQALRLPGEIYDGEALWRALLEKRDLMTGIPSERWDHSTFYRDATSSAPIQPGDITFRKAGFINIADFDNTFFGIPNNEALSIAPCNRLTLEVGFAALENANIPPSRLKGTDTGVFVSTGMDAPSYSLLCEKARGWATFDKYNPTGMVNSIAPGRLSYLLDVHGPSVAIDTACSGGLVALDQAVRYLKSSDAECALVVAVNSHSWPGPFASISAHQISSVNSRCATFTNDADGYVPSEGAVAFVVKKASAAKRDSDRILGIVRSTAVGHNGRSQGIAAPNQRAQIALQTRALREAGLRPSDIHFVEAHGTGTKLGDLIEIQGIIDVFRDPHKRQFPLAVGASKTCVGHTESAAGLVGVAAALQYLDHQAVPGLMHMTERNVNPSIELSAVPLALSGRTTSFADSPTHHGLVLSFGLAGTIAATVIESAPASAQIESHWKGQPLLFVISARAEPALLAYIEKYIKLCESASEDALASICYTSCVGREHYNVRFACVPTSLRDLVQKLRTRCKATTAPHQPPADRRLTFAFPGQGLHFHGMAHDLAMFSGFKAILRKATKAAQVASNCSCILDYLLGDRNVREDEISQHTQLAVFIYQYAVVAWLSSLGLSPSAVVGHSLGEVAAAVIAGILSFETAVDLVIQRERLLRHENGAMAIVALSGSALNALAAELELSDLTIAAYNSPTSHVISGLKNNIECFVAEAKLRGIRATVLPVQAAFHSPHVEPGLEGLRQWSAKHAGSFTSASVPFISSTLGRTLSSLPPQYWVQHARTAVHFDMAVAEVKSGVVLDIGPQPATWAIIQASAAPPVVALHTTTKPNGSQFAAFLDFVAHAFQLGLAFDLVQLVESLLRPPKRLHFRPTPISAVGFGRLFASGGVTPDLFDLLADHAVGHTRILPGAAMLSFIFSLSQRQNLCIDFHRPFRVASTSAALEFKEEIGGKFSLIRSDNRDLVSSGEQQPHSGTSSIAKAQIISTVPLRTIARPEVYRMIPGFNFGKRFQNIQIMRTYAAYTEATISVAHDGPPMHKQILMLDAVLHGFGAIINDVPLQDSILLVPASLQGVTLHSAHMPDTVLCRYYFPVELGDGGRRSISFDVLDMDRQLLLSCNNYTVAPVSKDVFTGDKNFAAKPQAAVKTVRMATRWRELDSLESRSGKLTSANPQLNVVIISSLDTPIVAACKVVWPSAPIEVLQWSVFSRRNKISQSHRHLNGRPLVVIIDLLQCAGGWESVATLLQSLATDRLNIHRVLALTLDSIPADEQLHIAQSVVPMLEGMFRVFLSEADLRGCGRILRVTSGAEEVSVLTQMLHLEMLDQSEASSTIISWRDSGKTGLIGIAPRLEHVTSLTTPPIMPLGVCVIAGMGSISFAIAASLVKETAIHRIVFIGRRTASDPSVVAALASLGERVLYRSADICSASDVTAILASISERDGPITTIIHAAAVFKDQRLDQFDTRTAQIVLDPKVKGAWNLHTASIELGCPIERFVMLSSISVPTGNPGQLAYAGANSFLDWLSEHRNSLQLPAISLQLGAWESTIMQRESVAVHYAAGHSRPVMITSHEAGIPLILQAMANPAADVEVIATFNPDECAKHPVFSRDILFKELIRDANVGPHSNSRDDKKAIFLIQLSQLLGFADADSSLDLSESLISQGVDSITFAQLNAKMLSATGVSIPLKFLSYDFSVRDIMTALEG
ncbi:hypothetical protein BKA62DRAFT_774277 [Auriculariales sp. MPI-PUGE-AT-0066]|nr:hypothetical protein BKA62DRAFT_774277 [Auriculariales sp. MPI-PUGE-AT-0066]